MAARGVACRRLDQIGQGRGPHAIQIGGDGVFDPQAVVAAAEQGRSRLPGEGPGHRLGIAHGRQRPPGRPHPCLTRAQHALRRRAQIGQGGRRQGAVALDAGDFFHQIGRSLDVPAPGRRRHSPGCSAHDLEPEPGQDSGNPVVIQCQPGQRGHPGRVEGEGRRIGRRLPSHHRLRRLAAAKVEDQPGGQLQAGQDGGRVHAAREPVLGIGVQRQRPAGLGRQDRVEPGAFDEDIRGLVRTTGRHAAHDAAEADRPLATLVGDQAHGRVDTIALAVEREQLFRFARRRCDLAGAYDNLPADQSGRIIDMQGPAAVIGDQVGHIDQPVDRAQADGRQPMLQPLG